VSKKVVGQPEQ